MGSVLECTERTGLYPLSRKVVDHAEEAKKAMTRRNQFEDMSKENPAVEKLRQVFNLELA